MGDGGRHPESVLLFKRIHRADVTRPKGARLMQTFLRSGLGRGRPLGDVANLSGGLTWDHRLDFFTHFFSVSKARQIPKRGVELVTISV